MNLGYSLANPKPTSSLRVGVLEIMVSIFLFIVIVGV